MTRRDASYQAHAPDLETVEAMRGPVLVDFGTDWCGHCIAARAPVDAWVQRHEGLEHLRIEDGRGRPLGRAFRAKRLPTLVLPRDRREIARAVRPREGRELPALDEALR